MTTDHFEELEEIHSPPSKGTFLRGLIAFLLILFLGITAFRIISKLRKKPKKKDNIKAISLKVRTQRVQKKSLYVYLKGYGTVQPYRRLSLAPELSGKVTYVHKPFKVGTFIKKGTTLFIVDRSLITVEYRRLKAQIASTKQQIRIASNAMKLNRSNLNRSKRLLRKRALDYGTFERAQQGYLDRSQRLEALRQSLAVNEILLKRAGINLGKAVVRAPFHGRISQGQLTRGSFVGAGRAVGMLDSVEAIEIPVAFPMALIQKIRNPDGSKALIKDIPTLLGKLPPVKVLAQGKEWKGRVVRTGANVDLATRTLTLYIKVTFPEKARGELLPGTFAKVKIPARQLKNATSIPRQALYKNTIYTVADGKLAKKYVSIMYKDSEIVILQQGLQEGEIVVTSALVDPIIGTPVFTTREKGKK